MWNTCKRSHTKFQTTWSPLPTSVVSSTQTAAKLCKREWANTHFQNECHVRTRDRGSFFTALLRYLLHCLLITILSWVRLLASFISYFYPCQLAAEEYSPGCNSIQLQECFTSSTCQNTAYTIWNKWINKANVLHVGRCFCRLLTLAHYVNGC